MMKNRYHTKHEVLLNQQGFTLIEILMAIVMISIIGSIIAGSYIAGTRIRAEQEDVVEMQQNIRVAFHLLARDLRMAGYELNTNWDPSLLRTANVVTGNNTSVNFSYVLSNTQLDMDGDGLPDAGQTANFSYSLVNTDLIRNNGANLTPVATNINAISFAYLNNNGVWAAAPPAVPSNLRAIGITLVAQAAREDRRLPAVARAFNDAFLVPTTVIYNSPADRFRRRTGSTVINLRNFGI